MQREASPELKKYLADEVALHSTLVSKWLGVLSLINQVIAGEWGLDRVGRVAGYPQQWAKEMEEPKLKLQRRN